MPRVSVIIPTYNRKGYVQEAIDSVLRQTYTDHEIVVIDDGSTDGTGAALRVRYGDRICYQWQENQGESAARNRGVEIAQGEYIALLDSDDLWLPEKLAKQVQLLDSQLETILGFSHALNIDSGGDVIGGYRATVLAQDLTLEALCLRNSMWTAPSTAVLRREAFELTGGYDESIRYGEDYDLFLRLRLHGRFTYIAQPLAYRRLHSGGQAIGELGQSLEQRLASRLKSLQSIFDSWPGEIPPGFQERALAHCYYFIGLLGYRARRPELAQHYLSIAIAMSPHEWGTAEVAADQLAKKLVRSAVDVALTTGESVQPTIYLVRKALDYWPPNLPLSRTQRAKVMGQTFTSLAFRRSTRHYWRQITQFKRKFKI